MSQTPLHSDDPRLTAYVLGELDESERAAVEAQLAECAQSRVAVEELRQTTTDLFDALHAEPVPTLTDAQRTAIHDAAGPPSTMRPTATAVEPTPASPGRRGIVAVITAAVCLTILVGVSVYDFSGQEFSGQETVSKEYLGGTLLAVNESLVSELEVEPLQAVDHLSTLGGQTGLPDDVRFDVNKHDAIRLSDGQQDEMQWGDIAGRSEMSRQEIASNAPAKPTVPGNLGDVTDLSSSLSGSNNPTVEMVVPSAGVPIAPPPALNDALDSGFRHMSGNPPNAVAPNSTLRGIKAKDSTPLWQTGQSVSPMPQLLSEAREEQLRRPLMSTQAQDAGSSYGRAGKTLGRSVNGVDSFKSQLGEPVVQRALPQTVPLFALLPSETAATMESAPLGRRRSTLFWGEGRWYSDNPDGDKVVVEAPGTEVYAPIAENEFLSPAEAPLSTFGLDVDTASYANVRRFLMNEGRFPPPDAVRIEELINYFSYSDAEPTDEEPLSVHLETAACPWNTNHRLVRIGLKAKTIDLAERPPTTLVFLIDTSGSMRGGKKLPLVKQSLRLLAREMTENDRISIVTYSNEAGLLLDSTSGNQQDEIIAAIDGLHADGSTNGEAGLKLAYKIATKHFIEEGQNRVILCTDGDFNVGTSATNPLVGMISKKRASGVFLSIFGFGSGNLKDEKLERIADTGNGQYHYIDGLKEARKVFLDELTGTLYTVAKDVKLQVEFNPANVAAYRLLGYENRKMAAEDFNNDRVDSGDMGAGHSVTALYEVVPTGVDIAKPMRKTSGVDPLKYRRPAVSDQRLVNDRLAATNRSAPQATPSTSPELLTVKLRYKQPDGNESVKREFPLIDAADGSPSQDLEWSAAVASFGMLLRGSQHAGQSSLEGILKLAQGAKGRDESGRRREFIDMVLQTQHLVRRIHGDDSPEPRVLSSVEARQKATVDGKYHDLLDKLEHRSDVGRYGAFHDYGWSADRSYANREGLPAGYWVYVYPDWYIWGETVSVK